MPLDFSSISVVYIVATGVAPATLCWPGLPVHTSVDSLSLAEMVHAAAQFPSLAEQASAGSLPTWFHCLGAVGLALVFASVLLRPSGPSLVSPDPSLVSPGLCSPVAPSAVAPGYGRQPAAVGDVLQLQLSGWVPVLDPGRDSACTDGLVSVPPAGHTAPVPMVGLCHCS